MPIQIQIINPQSLIVTEIPGSQRCPLLIAARHRPFEAVSARQRQWGPASSFNSSALHAGHSWISRLAAAISDRDLRLLLNPVIRNWLRSRQ